MMFSKWHGTPVVSSMCNRRLYDAKTSTIPTIRETLEWLYDKAVTKGPTEPGELQKRTMKHSYREARIPLGSDSKVREEYTSFYKTARFGRILEDLDIFAGAIAYQHCLDSPGDKLRPSMIIVSKAVNRIEFENGQNPNTCVLTFRPLHWVVSPSASKEAKNHDYIAADQEITMSGQVTWTGKSSMEVTMDLFQKRNNYRQKIIQAKFLMVARNTDTKGPAMVNALQPEGEKEIEMFNLGKTNATRMKENADKSLTRNPPSLDESLIIHNLFQKTLDPKLALKTLVLPKNSVWMEDAILRNLHIMFPQQRNLHNKIFGGYLMRMAFELAWATALMYCKDRPFIRVVDDICFRKPVEIGSLLFLSSKVVYTKGSLLQIKVHAQVQNPKDGTRETTTEFYFKFDSKNDFLPTVMPKTYEESMLYLDGKRHFERK